MVRVPKVTSEDNTEKLTHGPGALLGYYDSGAFLRSRCWPFYFDPTSQNRESDSIGAGEQAPGDSSQRRSLKALGGHPPRFINVGQCRGSVRPSGALLLFSRLYLNSDHQHTNLWE